ncbi:glycoside hydrolase family 127 protein [Amycolatopsis magusensis]|uniref:glycoside hydrolase family 127 protein n=1 Tax=Amycolatopsis magusensis TaxID=882444 RepID=UPI0024A82CE7|nr:beta-L-arabinofuranosidase domain-containing protein [Amycolatopsis magusensis]MDI5975948.1 glycoside hydrolase family 127 protein [Amycolatopsis magusensis]
MTVTSPDTTAVGGRPVVPSRGKLRPLGQDEVRITGGFWRERQDVNAARTIPHARSWMDRLGWTGAFTAPDAASADRRGREFTDSEVYKLLEAMSWEAGRGVGAPDALEAQIAELTTAIAAAQAADGYLHTAFGRAGQRARYSDLAWGHELYCTGHLLQAAVAKARTGGDGADPLLAVARRAADHVCEAFGPDDAPGVCGHPEIELGLVELFRLTGERRYLDQAALFVERRGHRTLPPHHFGWSYFSDDQPVRQSAVLHGHAVRALYLAAGAVDVAVETGDDDLLRTVAAQFDRALARRTYLTGGMGSRHSDEAFGDDFVLPADRAYSETCAGVAAIMLAWRLLLATGDGRYGEVVERILYNVVATAIADDGRSFFYAHTLHQRTPTAALPRDEEQLGFGGGPRAPWFEVSCCLPNAARLLAGLSCYLVTVDDTGLRLHQYVDSEISTHLDDGREVGLRVRTGLPDNGVVTVRVTKTDGRPWSITLRVPQWAAGAELVTTRGRRRVSSGDIVVYRAFAVGEEIRLELPTRPRFTAPDPRIDATRGCVAVERGPLVYCAEALGDDDLDTLRVDDTVPPVDVEAGVEVRARFDAPGPDGWPYGSPGAATADPRPTTPLTLVPYHRWARRGPSTMRVWLPTT